MFAQRKPSWSLGGPRGATDQCRRYAWIADEKATVRRARHPHAGGSAGSARHIRCGRVSLAEREKCYSWCISWTPSLSSAAPDGDQDARGRRHRRSVQQESMFSLKDAPRIQEVVGICFVRCRISRCLKEKQAAVSLTVATVGSGWGGAAGSLRVSTRRSTSSERLQATKIQYNRTCSGRVSRSAIGADVSGSQVVESPQTRSAMARVIPRSVHFRIENAKVGWIISGLSRRAHRGGEVEEWACQKVLQNAHMHRQTSNKQGRQPSRGAFLLCQR